MIKIFILSVASLALSSYPQAFPRLSGSARLLPSLRRREYGHQLNSSLSVEGVTPHFFACLSERHEVHIRTSGIFPLYFFEYKNTRNCKGVCDENGEPQAGKSPTCGLVAAKSLCRNFPFSQIELA